MYGVVHCVDYVFSLQGLTGETTRKEKNEKMGHGSDDGSSLISFRLCARAEVVTVGHETTEKARKASY